MLELEFLMRILVAGALAALLGLERESANRFAGLRTHIMVGIGSALFSVLGVMSVEVMKASENGSLGADPTRIIHSIALGIGFLGSGIVFVSRHDDRVHGLTTAASVWTTAAVGVAAAFAMYILAIGVTLLTLFVLRVLRIAEKKIDRRLDEREKAARERAEID